MNTIQENIDPAYPEVIGKFLNSIKLVSTDPSGPNYQSSRKLAAESCLSFDDDISAAFHLSEAMCPALRTLAVYREEQLTTAKDQRITPYLQAVENILHSTSSELTKSDAYDFLDISNKPSKCNPAINKMPLHQKYLRFSEANNLENFRYILDNLPKEWTIIQLTAPYNPNENLKPFKKYREEINAIYISLFRNEYLDLTEQGPITVRIPANELREGEKPLFVELYSLLDDSLKTIENASRVFSKNVKRYWEKREDIDLRMKSVISVMDKDWLAGWKCLLTGKLKNSSLRDKIKAAVDRTIVDWGLLRLTEKQKILLYNLMECSNLMNSSQVRSSLRQILTELIPIADVKQILSLNPSVKCQNCSSDFKHLSDLCIKCLAAIFEAHTRFSLVDILRAFLGLAKSIRDEDDYAELKEAERWPVILIVDELLDTFPWESVPMLSSLPISRMESIHLLYSLYCTHQDRFVDGYFLARPENGRYVINPENNLERMEKRMSSFVRYWCPQWVGVVNQKPDPETYLDYLREGDLFLYCGHGDGCALACGEGGPGVEGARGPGAAGGPSGARGAAPALLSGCGSVRLSCAGGRAPPQASHHKYHIANSPMVIGMLWEVTDLEVDKIVSVTLARFVPSAAPQRWEDVGKAHWSHGHLEIDETAPREQKPRESRDLLTAMASARRSTQFLIIASSIVARGLPIKAAVDP